MQDMMQAKQPMQVHADISKARFKGQKHHYSVLQRIMRSQAPAYPLAERATATLGHIVLHLPCPRIAPCCLSSCTSSGK
jgi:hypothetical protein